ncbi:MAG TPA: GntR family transcriptional regulator [Steroidobacteraceae bacterium]|jgi:DNA-binding GntR family transcriptional regulator|nr:GntR family transcriptional regulator [Steroidobacteraceae bacterium]
MAFKAKFDTRVTRSTLQDGVYTFIREALMSGEFVPGTRLTAREIAERTGTSVMPVREAFRRLMSEGALEPLSTGATRVPVFSSERIAEIMDIRLIVEGFAARRAASRITDEELRELVAANDQMVIAMRRRDPKIEARANEHFHFSIYRAAGSEELMRIIEHLWLKFGPPLLKVMEEGGDEGESRIRRTAKHHAAIIAALRQRDPERAAAALQADLTDTSKFYDKLKRAKN